MEITPKICDKIVKCKQSWRRSGTSVLSLEDFKQKVYADVDIGDGKLSNKLLDTAVYYLDIMGEVRRIRYLGVVAMCRGNIDINVGA